MTWAMNADDPMRIFAFVNKSKQIPKGLRPYFVMADIPSS
jgi:hypothetical protein